MMNALLLIGLLLSASSGTSARQAFSAEKPTAGDSSLHPVGRYYTGSMRSIEAVGDTVFYGSGFYLVAASIADPAHPVELGRFRLAQPVRTHALWNDEVYVACQDSLYLLRLGRRGVWRKRGPVSLRSGTNDLVVQDGLAYVAVDWVGLQILDVRSPGRPREVGHFALPIGTDSDRHAAFGIDVVGSLAFLATTQGLRVLNVSDPTAPTEISFTPDEGAYDVVVRGETAYLAGYEVVYVVDVSDPAAPVELGRVEMEGWAHQFVVAGGYAYAATGSDGFQVLDVSDPRHPRLLGHIPTQDYAVDVALAGHRAYVASQAKGVRIVDVTNPEAPAEISILAVEKEIVDVAVEQGIAYAAADRSGLLILDVTDPADPRRITSHDAGDASSIAVAGDLVFVGSRKVHLVDVSNPAIPETVGLIDVGGSVVDIVVQENVAYLAGAGGFRLFDVSDPRAPRELSALLFCQEWSYSCARRVFVAGSTAYLVDFERGIRLLDVTDPEDPVEVGFFETPTYALDVWIENDRAYVITDEALHVVDVGDPRTPKEIAMMDLDVPSPTSITVAGDYAYVSFFRGPLLVVDVTTPSTPHLVSRFDMYGARMVNVAAGLAYLAAGDLVILESPVFRTGTVKPAQDGSAVRLESYPNPFQDTATIIFTLDRPSERVTLAVYDVLGRSVAQLVNGARPAGEHRVVWDSNGKAPGVYVYRLTVESAAGQTWHATGRFVLVK